MNQLIEKVAVMRISAAIEKSNQCHISSPRTEQQGHVWVHTIIKPETAALSQGHETSKSNEPAGQYYHCDAYSEVCIRSDCTGCRRHICVPRFGEWR